MQGWRPEQYVSLRLTSVSVVFDVALQALTRDSSLLRGRVRLTRTDCHGDQYNPTSNRYILATWMLNFGACGAGLSIVLIVHPASVILQYAKTTDLS